MTSQSPWGEPSAPQYINSRPDNPVLLPLTQPSFAKAVTASSNYDRFARPPTTPIGSNVISDRGIPENGLTESVIFDREKSFNRDPAQKNIARLVVNEDALRNQSTRPPPPRTTTTRPKNSTNPPVNTTPPRLPSKAELRAAAAAAEAAKRQPQPLQVPPDTDETQPGNGYWKTGTLFNGKGIVSIGPIVYDENDYYGPFGLNRVGTYIFYIGMLVFTFLAVVFLIMTAIFYSQSYPDSTNRTGTLVGIVVCAFAVYLGILIILVGLWHQKYQREHPKKRPPRKKPRLLFTPFGYYLYPQYFADINEQIHMQGYGTGKPDETLKTSQPVKPVEVRTPNSEPQKLKPPVNAPEPRIVSPKPEMYFIRATPILAEQMPPMASTTPNKATYMEPSAGTRKTPRGTKPADDRSMASLMTSRFDQDSTARFNTASQMTLQPYAGTAQDLRVEEINELGQTPKAKRNKPPPVKQITNAFYNDH